MTKPKSRGARPSTRSRVPGGPRTASTSPIPEDAVGGDTVKVRATEVGYYADARRRLGDVFTLYPRHGVFTRLVRDGSGEPKLTKAGIQITEEVEQTLSAEDQFSESWMERVDDDTADHTTTGNQDLRRKHDETLAVRQATGDQAPLG